MTSTVFTADGSYAWYSDFGMEEEHGHNDEDLNLPPLAFTKPDGFTSDLVNITDSAGLSIFKIQADGKTHVAETVTAKQAIFNEGVELTGDAVLAFIPEDANGSIVSNRIYRFGRAENIGDFTHEGDGVQLWGKFTKNNVLKDCAVQMGVLPQEPNISIRGFKNSGENYLEIKDEDGNLKFSINEDGHILSSYIVDPSNTQDTYHSSSVHAATSVYVGPGRVSYNNSKLRFYTLKSNHIPTYLAAAPYNVATVPTDVSSSDNKIAEWMHVARTLSTNDTIGVATVFPAANLASDFDELVFAEADDVYTKAEIDQDVTTLEASINVEKGRIDTILQGSSANLDSFLEIANAFASADSGVAGTVTALTTSHNTDISALDTRLDVLEVDPTTQALLTVQQGRIDTNIPAISLNTAK